MFKFLADFITFNLLGFSAEDHVGNVLNFFIYDSIKILVLIMVVIFLISFFRTFVSAKMTDKLRGGGFGLPNFFAALFGAITPFCSCSSIPLFVGFLKSGINPGVAFSFLITSPLVNEVAVVIMVALFGWQTAFWYAFAGITLGTVGGFILGKLKLSKSLLLEDEGKFFSGNLQKTFQERLSFAFSQSKSTLKKLLPYVLLGVALGAVVHGYVPRELIEKYVGGKSLWAVLLAVAIGIPIYAGCSTIVPVIFSISAGGVPLGTALAFMMAIAGLSLPEALILKRTMKLKLLLTFFGIVALGIILIGFLFNLFLA